MRNRYVLGFFAINIAFIITLLVLQSYTDVLGVSWLPDVCGVNSNSTHSTDITSGSKVEPVGLIFLFLFGAILMIQTIGMLIHRLGTFQHVVAFTKFECSRNNSDSSESVDGEVDDDEACGGNRRPRDYYVRRSRVSLQEVAGASNRNGKTSCVRNASQSQTSHSQEGSNEGNMGNENMVFPSVERDIDRIEEVDEDEELPAPGVHCSRI